MRRLFRRTVTDGRRPSGTGTIRVAGLDVLDVTPTAASGTPTTKAGRLSLRGRTSSGVPVKIVEAFSPDHARSIAGLAHGDLADLLPPVLGVEGSLVVSEWVEHDAAASDPDAATLGAMLARIHAIDVTGLVAAFDPWRDHVLPRARRAAQALGATERLEEVLGPALGSVATAPPLVSHPDLTPDNVVPVPGGHRIVDNELLGVGSTPGLDLANLARGLEVGRSEVLPAYVAAGGRPLDDATLVVTRALWLARMLGSWFIAGRIRDCRLLLDAGPESRPLPFER